MRKLALVLLCACNLQQESAGDVGGASFVPRPKDPVVLEEGGQDSVGMCVDLHVDEMDIPVECTQYFDKGRPSDSEVDTTLWMDSDQALRMPETEFNSQQSR